ELRDLASKHPNLVLLKLDVANPVSVTEAARIVERKMNGSGLNLLINNAAIYTPTASLDVVDAEDMMRTYETNAVGPMQMAQAFLPLLKKAAQESTEKGLSCSKAAIINISSVMGSIERTPATFLKPVISYRCSK
ncbi:SDR2B reductase, partial [Oreotrochilus melanogaster]|nr:SDR2B reductase [Oreotrochilus melanogaster]